MIVVVAEKPSVARDLAKVLGARTKAEGYLEGQDIRVTWCIGHLLELAPPERYDPAWKRWSTDTLPMLPERFLLDPRKGAHGQLAVLKRLLKARETTRIVNACDAGREGELIFRWLLDHVFGPEDGGRSRRPPVDRLWIASLTDQAIADGFKRLRPGAHFDPLGAAARCRSEADWLVGLNATRAMTLLGRRAGSGGDAGLLSVGRVQTPTLAMLTRREDEIDAFVPEPFWQVEATFESRDPSTHQATWVGRWFDPTLSRRGPSNPRTSERTNPDHDHDQTHKTTHDDRLVGPDAAARAEAIARAVAPAPGHPPRPAHIHKLTREEQRELAPPLFDLTALQKLANQRFGLSSERTLNAAQNLYERHKAITYPRTDSRFITNDIAPTLPALLSAQQTQPWSAAVREALTLGPRPQRKIVDDAEVGDHHAILRTDRVPELERLSPDERRVYELVARRFVAVFLPPAVFDKRTVITVVDTGLGPQHFRTEGRARLAFGWHAAEPPPRRNDEPPLLPDLKEGAPALPLSARPLESKTQPPKRHTEATLLSAMEHAGKDLDEEALRRAMRESGLGTPATRASIIETLLKRDYIRRDGRMLVPTPSGRALIASLPMPALRSAELTGRWEARLSQIADGRYDATTFMDEIRRFTREAVHAITSATPPQALGTANTAEVLGQCPVCGTAVTLGRKAYTCERKRDCTFVVFTKVAGKTVSPNLLKLLLSKGRSSVLPGFKSKAGKRFKAALVLGKDGTVTLDFGAGPGEASSSPDTPDKGSTSRPRASTRMTPGKTTPRKTPRERKPDSEGGSGSSDLTPWAATEGRPYKAGQTRPPQSRATLSALSKRERDPRPGCPLCKTGYVMAGRAAWGCTRWREGCKFVVPFEHGPGRLRLPDDEADRLFRRGQTRLIADLSEAGPARLVLDIEVPGFTRLEQRKKRGT